MKWTRGQRSEHIEDRRGQRGGLGRKLGAGTLVLALVAFLANRYLGVDLGMGGGQGSPEQPSEPIDPATDPERETVDFITALINDLNDTWKSRFSEAGKTYRPAGLVLFRDGTTTACGHGTSAIGPFYCPPDGKAYIDLSFFAMLDKRFGAPGDFAQAYVLAHEIGHHVQNVLGYDDAMRAAQERDPDRKNDLSVRFELQADCLAGVWGHSSKERGLLDEGDIEEGLRAAQSIGDDTLQKQGGGRVSPESWTHGSAEQRSKWLRRGLASGRMDDCDTTRGDP